MMGQVVLSCLTNTATKSGKRFTGVGRATRASFPSPSSLLSQRAIVSAVTRKALAVCALFQPRGGLKGQDGKALGRGIMRPALRRDVHQSCVLDTHLLLEQRDASAQSDVLSSKSHAGNAAIDAPRVREDHGAVGKSDGSKESALGVLRPIVGERDLTTILPQPTFQDHADRQEKCQAWQLCE